MKRRVILRQESRGQWALYNESGDQLTSAQTFHVVADAMNWAMMWASSWANVEVVLDEQKS